MVASIGLPVLYQSSTGRYRDGIITGNITGETADLIVFTDGNDWESTADKSYTIMPRYQKDMGTGVEEWMPNLEAEGLGVITETAPARSIGTAFQVSTTRPAFVSYSARVVSTLTLTTGQAGRIELRSDSSNPPTTVRARVAGGSTGTLAIGANTADTNESVLTYIVPAGHFVLLQSVNEVGTPTYSLGAQSEVIL